MCIIQWILKNAWSHVTTTKRIQMVRSITPPPTLVCTHMYTQISLVLTFYNRIPSFSLALSNFLFILRMFLNGIIQNVECLDWFLSIMYMRFILIDPCINNSFFYCWVISLVWDIKQYFLYVYSVPRWGTVVLFPVWCNYE